MILPYFMLFVKHLEKRKKDIGCLKAPLLLHSYETVLKKRGRGYFKH